LIGLVLALAVQSAPPYIQYSEKASSLARMTFATGACQQLRYEVDADAGRDLVSAFIDQAAIDLVGSDFAERMYLSALDDERAEIDRLMNGVAGEAASREEQRMRSMADLFVTRCAGAAQEYPSVVIANGDEDRSGPELIRRIQAEALASPAD